VFGHLDDVINIGYYSKNRIHVSEIERIIEDVAVVCRERDSKGEAPYAFVVADESADDDLEARIADRVKYDLATPTRPEAVFTVYTLPRTYFSGVLRRALEDLLNGGHLGDTDLLRNPNVLDRIAVEIQHHNTIRVTPYPSSPVQRHKEADTLGRYCNRGRGRHWSL
jgi:hypothetical protein